MKQNDYFDAAHTTPQGSKRIADKVFPFLLEFLKKIMKLINDNCCSWINDLSLRQNIKTLENESCDWLIIGAGYTGLSAARKLSQLLPNKATLVDAQLAGEASSRNSGYLVDTTLNDGFTSNNDLEN